MSANRKYKSSVFSLLFQEKEKLIELYNAIEGTTYGMDTEIEITTLEKVLYMDRHNDLSFTIDGKHVILIEHQSAINKNLPLRSLLYIARTYEKLIENKAIYREDLVKIPVPEIYALYNGKKDYPEETILKLSDAFMESGGCLELEVRVININYNENADVLGKSKTLKGYSYFVFLARKYKAEGNPLDEAIELAMKDCIEQNILKEFLVENGSEVINMLYTEFNMEDALQVREEEGEKRATYKVAYNLLDILDVETIAEKTGLTLEEVQNLKKNN